jgi:hypothetical protein
MRMRDYGSRLTMMAGEPRGDMLGKNGYGVSRQKIRRKKSVAARV